jgi:RNA polymerase II subunit A small phosphatase-like protein
MYPEQVEDAMDAGYMQDEDDCDFRICDVWPAIERPYVHKFLHWAFQEFEVGIWSSATQDYVDDFVDKVITDAQHGEPLFKYARDRCVHSPVIDPWARHDVQQIEYIKDLKKVKKYGYPIDFTIAVDNTPSKFKRQYGNLVAIPDFYGDPDDRYLLKLMDYLAYLKTVPNVREIDKRGWWNDK